VRYSGIEQQLNVGGNTRVSNEIGTGDENSEGFEVGGQEGSDEFEDGDDMVVETVTKETGALGDGENGVGGRSAFSG